MPMFQLDLGATPAVLFCKLKDLTQVYKHEGSNARPLADVPLFKLIRPVDNDGIPFEQQNQWGTKCFLGMPGGVATSSGQTWKEQRKIMEKNLSHLGMGNKTTMEDIIMDECREIVNK